ncbi:uncharacterized protein LOC114271231 [Camellia sinensis]|uniref:uncharacterized protein LOC114271231 n=1 Tax=Camellia sinensis TaxID=4442 RepID=UPI0010363612|nr:uncharacterized protein LOC114271231 [Camellia sinensis]
MVFEKGMVFEKRMIFAGVNNFRAALKDYPVETGFKIVRDKNEKSRVTTHCAINGCPWRIHASSLLDRITYKIKTLVPQHTYSRLNQNTEATSDWIAKKLCDSFKENPDIGFDTMQEIKKTNPSSFVKINYDNPSKPISKDEPTPDKESIISSNPVFKRIFISFEAMKIGFVNRYRPFIGVNGCHLKGPYGGVLISAIALDGNNGLFILAIGVVDCKCKESWTFFLEHLRTILSDALPTSPWTIMSDGQKGS